jgi:hypothetical protein
MSFDDHASFGPAKLADIGGRELPKANGKVENDGLSFSEAKLVEIGGRSLPSPQQGASTLSFSDKGDVDKQGKFTK